MDNPQPPKPERKAPGLESVTSEFQLSQINWLPWILIGLVVGGALLMTVYQYVRPLLAPTTGARASRQGNQVQQLSVGPTPTQPTTRLTPAQASANSQWLLSGTQLAKVEKQLATLSAKLSALNSLLNELPTSDAGRSLATNHDLVRQFLALRDHARVTPEELSGLQRAIAVLRQSVDQALANPSLPFDSTLVSQAVALGDAIEQATTGVTDDLQALELLASSAAAVTPGSTSLADAIKEIEKQAAQAHLARTTAARELQREELEKQQQELLLESDRRVKEAEFEQERTKQSARVQAAEAAAARDREALQLAKEQAEAELQRMRKLKKFEQALPEIRSLLAPMITSGKWQIRDANGWEMREEGPVSLRDLKRTHTLELNERGMFALGGLFCSGQHGRPMGSFPTNMSFGKEAIRRAQELLVEYGDILVEKKLLRP